MRRKKWHSLKLKKKRQHKTNDRKPHTETEMTTSAQLRDSGIATVDRNTSQEWKDKADMAIRGLALSGQEFTSEQVRELAGNPDHQNCMGSRIMHAIKQGWIKRVGVTNATRKEAHSRLLPVYRGDGV